ncbi:MAG: cysteine hydrolase [Chloroflexi bacterium]|nr:cysteine hydrolase [Chloroflexota bacterium]
MTAVAPDPSHPVALVVVDVQQGFVVPETQAIVPRIVDHIEHARERYALVIATRFVNRPGSLYETERDWPAMADRPATDLLPGVRAAADLVITKHGLAPRPEDLVPALRERDVERVELCGIDTDQCVLATALLLWDARIAPRVLAELCASSGGVDMHTAGLAIARRSIGDRNVTDTRGRPI